MEILGIPLESLFGLIAAILTAALGVVGPKLSKYHKVIKIIMNAVEDEDVSEKELKKIVKAIKALF